MSTEAALVVGAGVVAVAAVCLLAEKSIRQETSAAIVGWLVGSCVQLRRATKIASIP